MASSFLSPAVRTCSWCDASTMQPEVTAKGHGLRRLHSRYDCPLTKNMPSGAFNVNSLKQFRDVSPEDATGTSGRCSDLHSSDNSTVWNVQDSLHLQEVEGLLTSKRVDDICTILIAHMDRNISFPQWTMGLVEGRDMRQSYHRAPQECVTRIIIDASARLERSPEVCHGRRLRRSIGSQTAEPGPANEGRFRLTCGANKLWLGLTLTANEPTFGLLASFGEDG